MYIKVQFYGKWKSQPQGYTATCLSWYNYWKVGEFLDL